MARAQPGKLTYGSYGTATVLHLSMAMLLDQARTDALHVPYESSGDMVTGPLGQQITLFNETPAISTQYRLRSLAVLAEQRLGAYPDVPTAADAGCPLQASVRGGLIPPKGLGWRDGPARGAFVRAEPARHTGLIQTLGQAEKH